MTKKEKVNIGVDILSVLLVCCLLYSRFFLSVAMIGLILLAFYYKGNGFQWRMPSVFLAPVGILLLVVITLIYSDNVSDWFHHFKMKLPFLALPLAFYNLPSLSKNRFFNVHYFFAGLVIVSTIPALIHLGFQTEPIIDAIGRGKSIPLPVQHVKFSIFLSFAIVALMVLYRKGYVYRWKIEKYIQPPVILIAIIALHLLAIRTGILVFYIALLVLSVIDLLKNKKWKTLVWAGSIIVLLPVISYQFFPTFKQKMDYMTWDLGKYRLGEGAGYSDSERITSIKIGWEIIRKNPVVGVGFGDLKDQCREKYFSHFGPEKPVLYPHNQYLFITAASGILGLLFFLFCLAYPYASFGKNLDPLWLSLGIIAFLAFLIDNLLERSMGVGFYAFFLSLGLNYHWYRGRE